MRGRIGAHLRSNVVGYLALLAALTLGTAYAADKIGSKDIKRGAVKTKHVRDGSLLTEDFRAGQLPAGPQGQPGQPGGSVTTGDLEVSISAPASAPAPATFSHTVTVTNLGPLALRPTTRIRVSRNASTLPPVFHLLGDVPDERCEITAGDDPFSDTHECRLTQLLAAGESAVFEAEYDANTCATLPLQAITQAELVPIELDPNAANDADEAATDVTGGDPC